MTTEQIYNDYWRMTNCDEDDQEVGKGGGGRGWRRKYWLIERESDCDTESTHKETKCV